MNLTRKRLVSTTFTLAVIALLYFSGPTTAITVALDAIAGTFYPGQTVTMAASITLQDYEFIMTTGAANLTIQAPNGTSITCSLPINGTTTNEIVTCSDGKNITVTSTSSNNFAYDYGYGYNSGYGYAPVEGYQTAYSYSYGYGYAYNDVWQSTLLNYTIKWPIPYNYGNGTYTASISAYAGSTLVSTSASRSITVLSLAQLPRETVGVWISELLPNPVGTDSNSTIPGGEWVELANTKNTSIDVSGWKLEDVVGQSLTISESNSRDYSSGTAVNSTVIPANGFLVVFRRTSSFSLNNDEDTVTLKNASDTVIDVVPYDADDFVSLFASMIAAGASFPAGFSLILQSGVNESACTGVFIGGYCYSVSDDPTPGTANPGSSAAFSKTLTGGNAYNLLSIPVIPSNTSVNSTLTAIADKYDIVWQYNASAAQPWSSYEPADLASSDLNNLDRSLGYWIRVNDSANQTLSVSGTAPTTTTATLVGNGTGAGYNLIGFPASAMRNISTALTSITGNYSIVWAYNASAAQPWSSYEPADIAASDLDYLHPGFGYWVKVNVSANQTLSVTY